MKADENGTELEYRLFDTVLPGILPAQPAAHATIQVGAPANPAEDIVTFDMRRILSIPATEALPQGVHPEAAVNLRNVLDQVFVSIAH